jgi:hypothetical protein
LLFLNTSAFISDDEFGNLSFELFPMIPMRGHRSHGPPSPISPGMPRLQQSEKIPSLEEKLIALKASGNWFGDLSL